jgi:hypothetical protein
MTTPTEEQLNNRLDDLLALLELFISRYPYHPFSQHFRAALAPPAVIGKTEQHMEKCDEWDFRRTDRVIEQTESGFVARDKTPTANAKTCAFPNCDCASECDVFLAAAAAQRGGLVR